MKNLIKNLVSESFFLKLVEFRDKAKYFKLSIEKRSKLTAFISMVFDRRYLNEHYSFLQGAYKYEKSLRSNKENKYFLRRNVHRLEKGLIMKPRKDVFALRFIQETVIALEAACVNKTFVESSEYTWCLEVLFEYFSVTNSKDKRYTKSKEVFLKLTNAEHVNGEEIPVLYENTIDGTLRDGYEKLLKQRKSVRWYKPQSVPRDKIEHALLMASKSPSSCNRQPFRYVIIDDPTRAPEIAAIPAGTVGWSHNVPCIAVLVADQSAFSNTANRHSIYVDATLSVMPFVLSLESQGLSSCIINWADEPRKERLMSSKLKLTENEKVILSISIGYASEDQYVPYSKRKKVSELLTYV